MYNYFVMAIENRSFISHCNYLCLCSFRLTGSIARKVLHGRQTDRAAEMQT